MFLLDHKTESLLPRQPGPVQLLRVAHERWHPGSISTGRRPIYWTIGLVVAGAMRAEICPHPLPAGAAVCFAPGQYRRMHASEQGVEFYFAYLVGDGMADFVATHLGQPHGMCLLSRPLPVKRLYQNLMEECAHEDADAHHNAISYLQLILANCRRLGREPGSSALRSREQFAQAKRLIDEEWSRGPDIASLAEACGISHGYLCRLFREHQGCTPQQYVQRLRIQTAATELAEGGHSIGQLANRYDFSDQFAFSRAFKRIMGVPPSRYSGE